MTRTRLAWGLALVDTSVFVLAVAVDPEPYLGATVLFMLGIGAYVGIGAFLVDRVPGNPIGALMLATGTFGVATIVIGMYAKVGAEQDPPWPSVDLARTVGDAMFIYPILIALVGIPLVFPDGHLPSRRFRWVVLLLITGMLAWMLGSVFKVGVDLVVLVSVPAAFIGAVAAISVRFRRGDPIQRQQVKWLAAVVSVGATAVVAGLLLIDAKPDLGTGLIVAGILALFALPFVIGMAILRYRLYEIDRIVSRTIAYVVISAVLVSAYVGMVIVIGGPLGDASGGDTIAVALSTLAVAALFQPLRRRVQAIVDRRFDRARIDADRTTAAFSERLRSEMDIETVTTDLRETIHATIRPDRLGVWLREAGR